MSEKRTATHNTTRGGQPPRAVPHPWLRLLAGIAAVLTFIFGLGNLATLLPGAKHMAQVIEERDLRATAIFYTDFKESAEGSEYIRDCLDYPPGRTPRAE